MDPLVAASGVGTDQQLNILALLFLTPFFVHLGTWFQFFGHLLVGMFPLFAHLVVSGTRLPKGVACRRGLLKGRLGGDLNFLPTL